MIGGPAWLLSVPKKWCTVGVDDLLKESLRMIIQGGELSSSAWLTELT